MKQKLTGLTIFMFIIGIFAMYLGLGIMNAGDSVSGTGGAFGNEMAAIGGLWTSLGAVLVLLGILTFPAAVGFLGLKEWGRKNGIIIIFLISGLCVVAGLVTTYFDLIGSIIYFVLTVLALVCAQLLREKKTLFELGTGSRRRADPVPTYREVKHARQNVVIRQSKYASKAEHRPMVKCPRCGTMNEPDNTNCKMCAKPLG